MKKRQIQPEPEVCRDPKMSVGLDIGTTKIVVTMGYLCDDGKVDLCGYGKAPSTGVQYGLVINLQDTIDGITKAKQEVEEATGLPVNDVYVGIAGRHIKSISCTHTITRPNGHDVIIREDEIAKMTADMENYVVNNGKVIAVIPQSYLVDGTETLRPVGMVGQNVTATYQLIIGDDLEIKKIIKSVKDSGLTMKRLMLEPLASAISCLTEEEKREGVALIDIGGGTTDLIIYRAGVPVYIRVIPVGGEVITKDIQSLGMTYEEAENLKIQHGSCTPEDADANHFINLNNSAYFGQTVKINARDLALVINARVKRDILEVVRAEIEKSGFMGNLMRVVITGGGARLAGIKSLAEFIFQKRVRIGIPGMGFTQTLDASLKDPIYSTSLGLLAYGCKKDGMPYSPRTTTPTQEEDEEDDDIIGSDEVSRSRRFFAGVGKGLANLASNIMSSLTDNNGEDGVD
ncbi:MAG: cell division protein FtsA [Bacteroidales bacterium]|nr:cell division protein FtsA [Bacteroidales bacterium]